MATAAFIEDATSRMTLLSAQSHGVAALQPGTALSHIWPVGGFDPYTWLVQLELGEIWRGSFVRGVCKIVVTRSTGFDSKCSMNRLAVGLC